MEQVEFSPTTQAVVNAAVAVTDYGYASALLCLRLAAALQALAEQTGSAKHIYIDQIQAIVKELKQGGQLMTEPRKFVYISRCTVFNCIEVLDAIASDGTAWTMKEGVGFSRQWTQIPPLPNPS